MHINEGNIQAEVYTKTDKGIYYVKASFPDLNMYINSITVRASPKFAGQMWVQMPAFRIGARWIKPLEFSNDSQLQDLIVDAALRAVDAYNISVSFPDSELEDPSEALTKAIKDFNITEKPP